MTTDPKAPKWMGRPVVIIDLTGKVFPWYNCAPVLLSMPGSPSRYLACFTEPKTMEQFLTAAGIPWHSIKQIEDGQEFLDGIWSSPGDVKVILDPYFTPEHKVRFTEVFRP